MRPGKASRKDCGKVAPPLRCSDLALTLSLSLSHFVYRRPCRQAAINLFLAHYRANECDVPIWELESDSYLPRLYYDDEASAEGKRGAEEAGWGTTRRVVAAMELARAAASGT